MSWPHGAAPTLLLDPPPITLPQPEAGTAQSLGAPLGSSPALGVQCSPLPVTAVTAAGSLSRPLTRLVMLIW